MKKLLIFDSNAIMYHVYSGYGKSPTYTAEGIPNYMLKGFYQYTEKAIKEQNPDYVVFVFDPKGKTFRHEIYPEYKGQRPEKEEAFKVQEPFIQEYLSHTGYPVFCEAGFEGDDLIGTIALRAAKSEHFSNITIYTGDKDMLQIVDDKIHLYNLRNKIIINPTNILEHFPVTANKVIDYLTLLGDKVDNVKGVEKCGEKSAIALMNSYSSIEEIHKNINNINPKDLGIKEYIFNSIKDYFINNYDDIKLSKYLITLRTDMVFNLSTKTISRKEYELSNIFNYLHSKNLKPLI
jgi:DNA polymerase-1